MAKVSNAAGRGFTHRVAINLDDYNATSGNADQALTLFTSTTGFIVKAVAITSTGSLDADGGVLDIEVGDGSDQNGLVATGDISGDDAGTIAAYNNGAYFNDGTTANAVNGKGYLGGGTITGTLTLDAGNWSNNSGGSIIVLMDIAEAIDFV
jgi:hypothetical protein